MRGSFVANPMTYLKSDEFLARRDQIFINLKFSTAQVSHLRNLQVPSVLWCGDHECYGKKSLAIAFIFTAQLDSLDFALLGVRSH